MNTGEPNQLMDIQEDVWRYEIVPCLRLKNVVALQRTAKCFDKHWKFVFAKNEMAICVPEDVPTLDAAMAAARIFSLRQAYTRDNTVKIMLGEGEHDVDGNDQQQHGSNLKSDIF